MTKRKRMITKMNIHVKKNCPKTVRRNSRGRKEKRKEAGSTEQGEKIPSFIEADDAQRNQDLPCI
jgi:hypothetical protein